MKQSHAEIAWHDNELLLSTVKHRCKTYKNVRTEDSGVMAYASYRSVTISTTNSAPQKLQFYQNTFLTFRTTCMVISNITRSMKNWHYVATPNETVGNNTIMYKYWPKARWLPATRISRQSTTSLSPHAHRGAQKNWAFILGNILCNHIPNWFIWFQHYHKIRRIEYCSQVDIHCNILSLI